MDKKMKFQQNFSQKTTANTKISHDTTSATVHPGIAI